MKNSSHPDSYNHTSAPDGKPAVAIKTGSKTARTFVWAAVSCILIGMTVMSPAASLLLYALAMVFAAIATILGSKVTRIVGALLLTLSLGLLALTYPQYDAEMTAYRARN